MRTRSNATTIAPQGSSGAGSVASATLGWASSKTARSGFRKRWYTLEPQRIAALPRRNWRDLEEETVRELTAAMKTPTGCQVLRGLQAVALRESAECGGSFLMGGGGIGERRVSPFGGG